MKKYKIIKIIFVIIVLIIILFMGYLWKYQQIVNEGSEIADRQCLIVQPLIDEKKSLYDNSLQPSITSGDTEGYMNNNIKYLDISKKYIKAQEEWLAAQRKFISRWDYKLFAPSFIQDLSKQQFISRDADVEAQKALDESFAVKDNPLRQYALADTVIKETAKRNKADSEYEKIWKIYSNKIDLRTYFIKVPQSACLNIN